MFETDSFCAETSFIGSESSFAEDPSETVDCDGTSSPAASFTADEEVPSDNEAPRMDLLSTLCSKRPPECRCSSIFRALSTSRNLLKTPATSTFSEGLVAARNASGSSVTLREESRHLLEFQMVNMTASSTHGNLELCA